jgi:hypothetical protein
MEVTVSEDAIAKHILKFVRQLDGGDDDDVIFRTAINRRWLDNSGRPTPHGRDLIQSFHELERIGRPQD